MNTSFQDEIGGGKPNPKRTLLMGLQKITHAFKFSRGPALDFYRYHLSLLLDQVIQLGIAALCFPLPVIQFTLPVGRRIGQ